VFGFDTIVPRLCARDLDDSCRREVAAFDELYAAHLGASNEDLSSDYHDVATAFEQLGELETGMTQDVQRTGQTLHEFAELKSRFTFRVLDDMLTMLRAKQTYITAHKTLLKHREAKQLDFEGLTDYLHSTVTERDRLANLGTPDGEPVHGNVRGKGMRGYMRHMVDRVWGVDEEQARIDRMQRLDGRIDELQDAVSQSHAQSQAFNQHVAKEHYIYELGRRREVQQSLKLYVDGHVDMYEQGVRMMDDLICALESGTADPEEQVGNDTTTTSV
jgi:hypothetical protein